MEKDNEEISLIALKRSLTAQYLQDTGKKKTQNTEEYKKAKQLFDVIHMFFFETYGDLWLSKVATDIDQRNWCVHLLGLSLVDVSRGISAFCTDAKSEFPPNYLHFRGYCLRASGTPLYSNNQSGLRILN